MIRDISIIVVIFAIVLFSHNYVQGELKNNSEELLSRLDELKVQMQNESDNKDAIKDNVNDVYDIWKSKSEVWSSIVEHQELDTVERSIIGIKSGIETDEMQDALQKIEESKFLISLIRDKEEFTLKNIF